MPVDLKDLSEVKKLRIHSLDALQGQVGAEVLTPWFQMDEQRTEEFEHSTYLNEYANPYEETPGDGYGAGLVEGYHLLGMIDYLMNHVIERPETPRMIPWNYGLDRVRFVSVVRNNDRFRLRGTLAGVESKNSGVRVTLDIIAEVEGRETPAFVATQHALWATV